MYRFRPVKRVNLRKRSLNSELCRKALEKIGNPNILVNLVSRRVRQLNSSGGTGSRPLVSNAETLGAADLALTELVEDKLGWEVVPEPEVTETTGRRRKHS